jgi:hypothetical protein
MKERGCGEEEFKSRFILWVEYFSLVGKEINKINKCMIPLPNLDRSHIFQSSHCLQMQMRSLHDLKNKIMGGGEVINAGQVCEQS